MAGWTRFVLRYRVAFVVAWAVVLVLGGYATSRLSPLLPRAHSQTGRPFTQVRIYVSGDGRLCWWACVTVPE